MPGLKTNERPGTRAVLRHFRMSATKARVVLDLIRDKDVDRAAEILRTTPREAATVVGKVLASAVAYERSRELEGTASTPSTLSASNGGCEPRKSANSSTKRPRKNSINSTPSKSRS